MLVTVTFRIGPPAPFGVPEEGVTVLPAGGASAVSPSLHAAAGVLVTHGTLSNYRPDDAAISASFQTARGALRIHDNFALVDVEVSDPSNALPQASAFLDDVLRNLSVDQGVVFTATPLVIEAEAENRLFPVPKTLRLIKVSTYQLERLRHNINHAVANAVLSDTLLSRALDYYEHALLLFDRREQIAPLLSRHHSMVLAAVFLNLWKAASSIVGDPAVDSDYQKRYTRLQITHDYFKTEIEHLRHLRNTFDVAHYTPTAHPAREIEKAFGRARGIAAEVISKYREHLMAGEAPIPVKRRRQGDA